MNAPEVLEALFKITNYVESIKGKPPVLVPPASDCCVSSSSQPGPSRITLSITAPPSSLILDRRGTGLKAVVFTGGYR